MIAYAQRNALELILFLSLAALLLLVLRLLRNRKAKGGLEQERCGLWRYHKETQFVHKSAYGRQLMSKEQRKLAAKNDASKNDDEQEPKCLAVLEFDGDLKAKQHDAFAKLVDEVVLNAERFEEVVVKISSPGGTVPHYGHVFAEMLRLRGNCAQVTACVDVVAASGGYLAALPAHKIIAAPFALVGSIGVVAFVPNIRKLLERFEVNPRTFTAGKLKRTVSLTDNASEEEVEHFQSQLEAIHRLFIEQVKTYRPGVDLERVETGDSWTATESLAQQIGLVDEIGTSQKYVLERNRDIDVVHISIKRGLFDEGLGKFSFFLAQSVERLFSRAHAM